MDKPLKLYKLIILYILNRVDFPLTNAQISEFILEEGYTTYFKLQQAISELVEANLIREEPDFLPYYRRRDGDCLLFPQ